MHKVIKLSPEDKLDLGIDKQIETSNWNRDKLIKENPIDYIKMIKLMNSFPIELSHEVFKSIYRMTRQYIPDTLYKFYSITDNRRMNDLKIETLEKHEVFLSELSQFNDPYDGRAIFYNPEELKQFDVLKEQGGILIEDFASFNIGTSLSATNHMNMPMWAHYSNNHCGYCVAYETSENSTIKTYAFPMQYLDARIDISDYMVKFVAYALAEKQRQLDLGEKIVLLKDRTLVFMIPLLDNIKGVDWSYEKEFRLSLPKTHPSRYIPLNPNKIYIGKNCDVEIEKVLIKIAKTQKIQAYKMMQGTINDNFNIVPILVS